MGGFSEYEGRVEVFINGQWGTVCDDLWSLEDGNVACRQLGLGPATAVRNTAAFGQGLGSILMDDVECRGDEPSLISCQYVSHHNCRHQEDAGVVCSPQNGLFPSSRTLIDRNSNEMMS